MWRSFVVGGAVSERWARAAAPWRRRWCGAARRAAQVIASVVLKQKRPDLAKLGAARAPDVLARLCTLGWAQDAAARPSAADWAALVAYVRLAVVAAALPSAAEREAFERTVLRRRRQRDGHLLRRY